MDTDCTPRPHALARRLAGWRVAAPLAAALIASDSQAQPVAPGRWEGDATTADQRIPLIVDLRPAPLASHLTLPGRRIQSLALVMATDGGPVIRLRAATPANSAASGSADAGPQLQLEPINEARALTGHLDLAGHQAIVRLVRVGEAPALHDVPTRPLPSHALGVWKGRYDLGFGPREATLHITPTSARLTIVGRRTSELLLDESVQRGALWMWRADAADLSLTAAPPPAGSEVLDTEWRQGPFEARVTFRREPAK